MFVAIADLPAGGHCRPPRRRSPAAMGLGRHGVPQPAMADTTSSSETTVPSVAPDLPRKLRRCLGPGSGRPRSRICDSWRPASATRLSAPRCSGTAVSVRALTATAVARAITASSRGRQWAVTRGRLWASCRGRPHCRSSRRSAAACPLAPPSSGMAPMYVDCAASAGVSLASKRYIHRRPASSAAVVGSAVALRVVVTSACLAPGDPSAA